MNLGELLGSSELLDSTGNKFDGKDLDIGSGSTLGLYFSAHWCPPCRAFTPTLIDFYNNINSRGKKFTVIFVSLDRDEKQFSEYFQSMPWNAVPFESGNSEIAEKYQVRGIPALLLFDSDGRQIVTKGDIRSLITTDSEGDGFPWSAK